MVANKLYVIFDDGRGEHVVVKPDEIATAVKVLTKEEDTLPQERRASKLLRASRGVAVEGISPRGRPHFEMARGSSATSRCNVRRMGRRSMLAALRWSKSGSHSAIFETVPAGPSHIDSGGEPIDSNLPTIICRRRSSCTAVIRVLHGFSASGSAAATSAASSTAAWALAAFAAR